VGSDSFGSFDEFDSFDTTRQDDPKTARPKTTSRWTDAFSIDDTIGIAPSLSNGWRPEHPILHRRASNLASTWEA
jgi:hypothetical protein